MITYSNAELAAILYMPLPTGEADVWLRQDIAAYNGDDFTGWTADEVYFRTTLSLDEVTERFDELFELGGEPVSTEQAVEEEVDLSRLDALEQQMAELTATVEKLLIPVGGAVEADVG